DVRVRLPDQALEAKGGTLRGEIGIIPLLFGRIELSDFDLSGSRITASAQALAAVNWADAFNSGSRPLHARRLILRSSSIHWTDLKDANLEVAELVIRWTGESEPLTAYGNALWRGERITLTEA